MSTTRDAEQDPWASAWELLPTLSAIEGRARINDLDEADRAFIVASTATVERLRTRLNTLVSEEGASEDLANREALAWLETDVKLLEALVEDCHYWVG